MPCRSALHGMRHRCSSIFGLRLHRRACAARRSRRSVARPARRRAAGLAPASARVAVIPVDGGVIIARLADRARRPAAGDDAPAHRRPPQKSSSRHFALIWLAEMAWGSGAPHRGGTALHSSTSDRQSSRAAGRRRASHRAGAPRVVIRSPSTCRGRLDAVTGIAFCHVDRYPPAIAGTTAVEANHRSRTIVA